MGAPLEPGGGGAVTLRELYAQSAALEDKLMAKMEALQTHLEASLERHRSVHELHDQRHETEYSKRSSMIRWAVTSVMTGITTVAALVFGILAFINR